VTVSKRATNFVSRVTTLSTNCILLHQTMSLAEQCSAFFFQHSKHGVTALRNAPDDFVA